MLAEQSTAGILHHRQIEPPVKPADPPMPQASPLRAIEQQIAVTPTPRTEPGMEIFRHRLRPADSDTIRQMRIHTTHPGRQGTVDGCVEMDDLVAGVDAGIGTSGTDDPDRLPGDLA